MPKRCWRKTLAALFSLLSVGVWSLSPAAAATGYQVFAFNDLGMHCYSSDFSTVAVLPPFNVLNSQVVLKGLTPKLLDGTQVNLYYSAAADPSGSINRTSRNKTNFWQFVTPLFGVSLPVDTGLLGAKMPGARNVPQPMIFDPANHWFSATGIPITMIDDSGRRNSLPLMKVAAYDKSTGALLSAVNAVVPASDEMACSNCHNNGGAAAGPATSTKYGISAWSANINPAIQVAENILILHDGVHKTNLKASKPVLCASCHYSPALDLDHEGPQGAQAGKSYLSMAMHSRHGKTVNNTLPNVTNPAIISSTTMDACYQCHPGKATQCLRGVMATNGMNCQNCHGGMLAVGGVYNQTTGKQRIPWVDEPKCQSCHTGDAVNHLGSSITLRQAYSSSDPAATPIVATNQRFAENSGKLYRFSKGHGGLNCAACHGSPHAEWPTRAGTNDNLTAIQIQGHAGTVTECATCHGTGLRRSLNGPHGMHNIDANWWNGGHEDFVGNGAACKTCHGADGLGTVLSKAKANRTFNVEGRTISVAQGTPISCTLCHKSNRINGGD